MKPLLILAVLTVLIGLAVGIPASCGETPGEASASTEVRQLVTRDHGSQPIREARIEDLPADATVLGLLEQSFEVAVDPDGTVAAIEGHEAGGRGGPALEWSHYVNGVRQAAPPSRVEVKPGQRIWWDLNSAPIEPAAVVGSFPEPFVSGIEGERRPVRLECGDGSERSCDEVTSRLEAAGVATVARGALNAPAGNELLRVVVGSWDEIRRDPTVRQLERAPRDSGVFAQFAGEGRRLALFDGRGRKVRTLGAGTGLVAAVRFQGLQPSWVVTGTDAAGVAAAATAMRTETLERRFAAAIERGRSLGLPLTEASGGA